MNHYPNTPLSRTFNVAVNHIAAHVLPCGFDVSENAPQSFDELIAHYKTTGRVLVWSGASDRTIFDCPETNYSFRAWHDSKHIIHNLPFTRDGEHAVMIAQCRDIMAIYDGATAALFCNILEAEITGQFDYAELHGAFPSDQMDFVRDYLTDPRWAIIRYYGTSPEAA